MAKKQVTPERARAMMQKFAGKASPQEVLATLADELGDTLKAMYPDQFKDVSGVQVLETPVVKDAIAEATGQDPNYGRLTPREFTVLAQEISEHVFSQGNAKPQVKEQANG